MSFEFDIPTTGALSWASTFPASSKNNFLLEASAVRGQVRDSLKTLKHSGNRDFVRASEIIEEYLPYILEIENLVRQGTLDQSVEITASWRCTLTESPVRHQPRVEIQGIEYEVASAMMALAITLQNWVNSIYAPDISATQQQLAANTLCRVAGIYQYIGQHYSQKFPTKPVDLCMATVQALERVTLADAQLIAVEKSAASKSAAHALLARICISSQNLYSAAQGLIASVPAKKELSSSLQKYIVNGQGLCMARAFKFLGLVEQNAGQYGNAVCYAQMSLNELGKTKSGRIAQERAQIKAAFDEWQKTNNTITFQKVPDPIQLRKSLPSGRELSTCKPFKPNDPKQILSTHPLESTDHEPVPNYAGQGQYY